MPDPTPEEEFECQQPCDPDTNCDGCAEYWARMIHEGYWNGEGHRWTDKGWKEITKYP